MSIDYAIDYKVKRSGGVVHIKSGRLLGWALNRSGQWLGIREAGGIVARSKTRHEAVEALILDSARESDGHGD